MKKKVLIAQFKHETNNYSPIPADMKAFQDFYYHIGDDVIAFHTGVANEVGGYIDVFKNYPEFELVSSFDLFAVPSAPVTKDVYDFAEETIRRTLQEKGPFDGILLALHGAMVAEGHPDAEGDFVEMLRGIVGPDLPIVVTLDLHANVTEKLAKHATALVPFENYPHTDMYQTGVIGATIMAETLSGKLNPKMGFRYIPYLLPLFPSAFPEIKRFHDMAREYEKQPGVRCVRICHGFFPADIDEMGMSVEVVTAGDQALAQKIADKLGQAIWDARDTLKRHYISVDEALDIVEQATEGPIILADASDNPGAGGMGDTTHILRRILERGISGGAVSTIFDPVSAEACAQAGICNPVKLRLGGLFDPAFSGEPLEIEGIVEHLSCGKFRLHGTMNHGRPTDIGKTAVVNIGGNRVIVNSIRSQPYDLEFLRSCGIDPEEQRFIVVKSSVHYRAHYSTIAKQIIDLAVPGYAVPVTEGYTYRYWKTACEKK